jgi:hypothetical protein
MNGVWQGPYSKAEREKAGVGTLGTFQADNSPRTCNNCNENTHFANNCPHPARKPLPQDNASSGKGAKGGGKGGKGKGGKGGGKGKPSANSAVTINQSNLTPALKKALKKTVKFAKDHGAGEASNSASVPLNEKPPATEKGLSQAAIESLLATINLK